MHEVIFKYRIPLTDSFILTLPIGWKVLFIDVVRGEPHMWIYHTLNTSELEDVKFAIRATGELITEASAYQGSFILNNGQLVFHVFEVANA